MTLLFGCLALTGCILFVPDPDESKIKPIQQVYADRLAQTYIGMPLTEFRGVFPEAYPAGQNGETTSYEISLKQIVNSSIVPRSEGKGIILGEPIDPVSIYQAEMAYYKEQLNIDQALATIDNIEVIQPFLRINHYNYPNYNLYFLYFFLLSLAVAGFTVLQFGKNPK